MIEDLSNTYRRVGKRPAFVSWQRDRTSIVRGKRKKMLRVKKRMELCDYLMVAIHTTNCLILSLCLGWFVAYYYGLVS